MTDAALASPLDGPSDGRSSAPSLRQLLRSGTTDRHAALDRIFEGMTEAPGPGLYQRFIAMNYAAHSALEPLLDGHVELDATIGSNSRTILLSALASDMRQMGLHPAATIPFPVRPVGLPEAAGIAYVLDGSRLGARFIHRDFLARGLARRWPGISTAYLEAAARADGFRDRMNDLSVAIYAAPHRARALAAANAAFALFEAAIAGFPHPSEDGTVPS